MLDRVLVSGARGKLLALALTAIVMAMLWLAVIGPLADWYAERADLLEHHIALERRMAVLADTLPELQQQVDARAVHGAPPPAMLDGASDAIAGAKFQGQVQDIAKIAGAELARIETLAAEQRGPYRKIGLRISVSAPWPTLVELMRAFEAATPRMLIDDLELRGVPMQMRGATPPIDAAMTIFAFRSAAAPTVAQ